MNGNQQVSDDERCSLILAKEAIVICVIYFS